jgi:hypothetical protein
MFRIAEIYELTIEKEKDSAEHVVLSMMLGDHYEEAAG